MNRNFSLYLSIICLLAFILIFLLIYSGVSSNLDTSAFVLLNETMNVPQLNYLFTFITLYGREFFWIPVVALLLLFGKTREQKAAILLIVAFIIVIIVGLALKDAYYRPRPFYTVPSTILLVTPDSDSSFPSGHAMIVMAGAVISLLMLRKRYSIPLLAEALIVCYSRIYVGMHYPLDVIGGGALIGMSIAFFVVYVMQSKRLEKLTDNILAQYNRILHRIVPSF